MIYGIVGGIIYFGRVNNYCQLYDYLRKVLYFTTVILVWTAFSEEVVAQDAHRVFEHLTTDHGISSDKVEAVLQDREGYYWIATQNGLNRFDGSNIKIFRHSDGDTTSLTHNHCTALTEDTSGDIWIATYKGVSRFRKSTGSFQRIYLSNPNRNFELANRIYSLVTDREGNIWIAGNGLWKYDIRTDQVTLFDGSLGTSALEYQLITHVAYDPIWHGHWFNTGYGIAFLDIATSRFYHKAFNPLQWVIFDAADDGELVLDTLNRLWFRDLTSQCLSYFDSKQNKIVITPKKATYGIKKIQVDDKNRIWIFYWLVRAEIFDPMDYSTDTSYFSRKHRRSVSSEQATSLFVDQRSNYWITSSHGISIYRDANQYYKLHEVQYTPGPFQKISLHINALAQTDPTFLWIATNQGLFHYHLTTGETQPILPAILNKKIRTLLADNGKLWLSMYDQLFCIDILSGKVVKQIKLKPGIFFIRKGSDDDLWIGLWSDGVYRLNTLHGELQHFVEEEDNPLALRYNSLITGFQDGYDFWVGYNAGIGLSRYRSVDDSWSHFHPEETNTSNSNAGTITVITKDKSGSLWLGTHGAGLFQFDPVTMQYTRFDQQQALSSNYINSIIPDTLGHLWISTADGMNFMNWQNKKIRPLDIDLVFMTNDVVPNGIEGIDGKLYFFCNHEFVEIDPLRYQPDHGFPKMILSNFSIFDKDQPIPDPRQTVELSYRENFFSFGYSVVKSDPLRRASYAYQLEGFDKDWVVTERSYVSYTNVPDGRYVFKIKVANDEGEWSAPLVNIVLRIKPPYWRTWWFITLSVVLIIISIYLFYQNRIQQIKKLFAIRSKISQDLHDEVGSTLSSIHVYSSVAAKAMHTNPEATRDALQQIKQNSHAVMENMSDIVWAINTGIDGQMSFGDKLKNYGYELLSPLGINCIYDIDRTAEKKLVNMEARKNILLIAKEAMNNMAKYSAATEASFHLGILKGHLRLKISDNGRGFTSDNTQRGYGLFNMEQRIASLGGKFQLDTATGKGTTIQCEIPLPNISDTWSGDHP